MSQSVRSINTPIIGMTSPNNLIQQIIPAIPVIDVSTFRAGDDTNELTFRTAPQTTGRLGIFAAEKDGIERAVMMLLPPGGTPNSVLICITQSFAQAHEVLDPLLWRNPLSVPFVNFALLKHVINRWGAQMLASGRNMALMYILRAKGDNELGPFAHDGRFLGFVLSEIATLTNNAFTFDECHAFTFSSGIFDFNRFLSAASRSVNISGVYSIDPAQSTQAAAPMGARRKQFASGAAGPLLAGFEHLAMRRWANEDEFLTHPHHHHGDFEYLHNRVMPLYTLNLALRTP
ncbi:MAG: hypothetical protein ABI999_10990 [Acidobacteriota bacterium]